MNIKLEMMKKFVCVIFTIALFFSAMAQDHLTFLGIPIDGSLEKFSQQLTNKGIVYIQEINGVNLHIGSCLGYNNCIVGVVQSQNEDLVQSVLVCIIEPNDWASLKAVYIDIRKKLAKEYGEPKVVEEMFSTPVKTDQEKYQAIVDGKCSYSASYSTRLGDIDISIENAEGIGPCITVQYSDNVNIGK